MPSCRGEGGGGGGGGVRLMKGFIVLCTNSSLFFHS